MNAVANVADKPFFFGGFGSTCGRLQTIHIIPNEKPTEEIKEDSPCQEDNNSLEPTSPDEPQQTSTEPEPSTPNPEVEEK